MRADGRWEATLDRGWQDGKRVRDSFYGKTRAEARTKLRAAQRAIEDGGVPADQRQKVGSFVQRWLDEVVDPSGRADSTKADYRWQAEKHVIPALGMVPLAKLTPQQVQSFVNGLRKKGLGPRSVQYAYRVLRMALDQAVAWDVIPRNPAGRVHVERPRTDPSKVYALTEAESKALLQAAKGYRLEALYAVAAPLGLRRGEALGLRWSDIDFEAETLRIEQQVQRVRGKGLLVKPYPKTASSRRTVGLPRFCVTALKAHKVRQAEERLRAGQNWQDHDLVFPSTIGTPMEPRNLNRHFHEVLTKAGIKPGRFHNLRHSAASLLLTQGVPMRVVTEVLGHSSMQVTADLYTHVVPVLLEQAANRLDRVFGDDVPAARQEMPAASGGQLGGQADVGTETTDG